MVVLGLLLGLVGTDVNSGTQRFSFGIPQLADGIGFVIVAMGMFGLAEIIRNLEREKDGTAEVTKITSLMPTKEDWKRMVAPILRGTAIGSMLSAVLPAAAPFWEPLPPTLSRRRYRSTEPSSAKARSKALPHRSRPTTPARKRPLFRCSPWGFHQTRSAR